MANIINIANKLNNEPVFIVLGEGKQYKVDNRYKIVMQASALIENGSADSTMKAIELVLGKEARKQVEELPLTDIQIVMTAVMAAIQGKKYDDIAARFPEQDETAG